MSGLEEKNKPIVGRAELVDFPVQHISAVPARVDTGARTSSLWASDITEENGKRTFKIFGEGSEYYNGETVSTWDFSGTVVSSSIGNSQIRYKVNLPVRLGGKRIKASFTLADRSKQVYPVLIGRNTLMGKFVVDVKAGTVLVERERNRTAELRKLLEDERIRSS